MNMLSDVIICSAAVVSAIYCLVLSRRLQRFTDLEGGVGAAVTSLSTQVDELRTILTATRAAAENGSNQVETQVQRAEAASRQLQLLLASMSDLEDERTGTSKTGATP